ncbi:hypothetical protein ACPPVO_24830 [Dactylosporangium sp. McL0621]|uniref:hypothetical protein n=1 Tax=Dactylosporangium sp. McL0621 TaxID=3415678 RepID=UPI003CF230F8
MTVGMWIPVTDYLTGWAENLFPKPDLSELAVVGHSTRVTGGVSTAVIQVELGTELTLALPGIDIITAQLLPAADGSDLTVEFDWTGPFRARLLGLGADLVIDSTFLVPVDNSSGRWEPTGAQATIGFTAGLVELDGSGGITFSEDVALSIPPLRLGDTGFVIEATGARLSFSGEQPPPDTAVEGFRGLLFDSATVYFPDGLDVAGITPDSIEVVDGAIGTGGFSGAFTGSWDPVWDGLTPSGEGAGTLLGFAFGLDSLELQIQQDVVTGAAVMGTLAVPFFDQLLTASLTVDADGGFAATVTGTPDSPRAVDASGTPLPVNTPAIAELSIPGVANIRLDGLGLVRDGDGAGLLVTGELDLVVGAPALDWPTIAVQDLRIAPDGHVHVPGGWIDLPQPIALDLYGFGMEITRIGFGTEDDGRRWVGVDGSVRLTELLPAGASARGLRVLWDPADPARAPQLTLDGLAVGFTVAGVAELAGEVALVTDASGAKSFTGALRLGLDPLDIGIDAGLTIGRKDTGVYAFLHLGVDLPLPLGATGTALYGLEGLLAVNMAPTATGGDWYGWYKQGPVEFSATEPSKWAPETATWAIGAGASIGTLPDAGFSVNTRALLVAVLPGPVLLLQGTADLLKIPPALSGSAAQEGTLGLLAALDGRAATLQLGIDASWSVPVVLSIAAATEAFFDFDRSDAWHVWIGKDTPASARIRAEVLSLFHADAWLMLGADGIATGLGVSWGDRWRYGPASIEVRSWISAAATLSKHPAQLTGALHLGGTAEVALGPFGVGLAVRSRLTGKAPSPYEVAGRLAVTVELPPPLKDLDVDLELSWRQPAVPLVEDPWSGALAQHPLCTETWTPLIDGTQPDPDAEAPLVPLDAGVLLTFGQPMGDPTAIADNPPASAPTTVIGDYTADYSITRLTLSRRRRSQPDTGWQDVTGTVFGTWTPDAASDSGVAGSRLQLMARSPFAFTRFSSRRWTDDFLAGQPDWPCGSAPPEPICLTWTDQSAGTVMPRLWLQDGAVLSGAAPTVVNLPVVGHVLMLGQRLPLSRLWVTLPEPAAEVTAQVAAIAGPVVLSGWNAGTVVATREMPAGQGGDLTVTGDALQAVTVDAIGASPAIGVEAGLAALCWRPAAAARTPAAEQTARLTTAVQRWADTQPIFEPDCHYLLEVTTRARLASTDGTPVQDTTYTHTVRFQTGGPPAIPPDRLRPPPVPATGFPFGGVLADLTPYLQRTVPDPGAAPVFRAYDLSATFRTDAVPQLYGGDLTLRLYGEDGQPVRDGTGADIVLDCAWQQAPTTTVTDADAAWLTRLTRCLGTPGAGTVRGDDLLHAALPAGTLLPARRALTARLSATRPLFTDPFTDLAAFEQQVLGTGSEANSCTAAGGIATIARPAIELGAVVALAGDLDVAACTVACTARPAGPGSFGLVAGHSGPDRWVALELTVGGGRQLVSTTSTGSHAVLWHDDGAVTAGVDYALALTCTSDTVTARIDDLEVTVPAAAGPGRFGLLSGIRAPQGCQMRDLVVRSAPATTVYSWRFTTSAYPGLPEMLATFTGTTWPAPATVDTSTLASRTRDAANGLSGAAADLTSARQELAAAVSANNTVDLQALVAAAGAAVQRQHAEAADSYDSLAAALALAYRPAPPVVEVLTAADHGRTVALVLDLPEPLPWERLTWSLTPMGPHPTPALNDVVLAWSADGSHAMLARTGGKTFPPGPCSLALHLALEVGAEAAVWTRNGRATPEEGTLQFTVP